MNSYQGALQRKGSFNEQIQYAHRLTAFLDIALISLVTIIAALKYRQFKVVIYPLYSVLALFLVEVILGRSAAFNASTQLSETLHLAVALAILSLLILATVATFYFEGQAQSSGSLDFQGPFRKLILALLAGLLLLITSGEFVVASGSGQTCKVWLTCSWQILTAEPLGWIPLMHSFLAGLVSFLVIARFFLPGKSSAVALWAALCVLAVSVGFSKHIQQQGSGNTNQSASFRQRVKDYFMLTKPLIVALLLVTTVTGMVMGGRGFPALHALLWTLVSGVLAAGGSSAIN